MGWKDVSDEDLAQQIRGMAEVDDQLNEFMTKEVVPYWRSVSPFLKDRKEKRRIPGDYKASVKVTRKARRGKGTVSATHWYAHFIEDGTSDTPEFAPGGKTAARFGGTLDRGGDVKRR